MPWKMICCSFVLAGAGFALGQEPGETTYLDRVYYDIADEAGNLTGGFKEIPITINRDLRLPGVAAVVPLTPMDNPLNRIDIVFVGDGYTADELDVYAAHVDLQVTAFFLEEPFITYAPFFNIHRVDVISNESGVDHDPDFPFYRDTAMDMEFFCGGTERLLCVNVGKARGFANNAPDVDLIAALANSMKYGGAGYSSSDLATASGGNGSSTEVLLHEFGHALGNLADEYDYGSGDLYTGGEVPEPNVSIYAEGEMLDRQTKWFRWLGVNDPAFDGLISTYEGARYWSRGIYRPTNNSLMRSLGRPFNLPSVESIIVEIYKIVSPIDDASPSDLVYGETDTLFVDPVDPVGHALDVQWYADGEPIPGATSETLDIGSLGWSYGWYLVHAVVTDNTDWVRDESLRDQWMTAQTEQYLVEIGGDDCLALDVQNLVAGNTAVFTITGGDPGAEVAIVWGVRDGESHFEQNRWCVTFGFDVPRSNPGARVVASGVFDGSGIFTTGVDIPANLSGRAIRFQAAQRDTCPGECQSPVFQGVIE